MTNITPILIVNITCLIVAIFFFIAKIGAFGVKPLIATAYITIFFRKIVIKPIKLIWKWLWHKIEQSMFTLAILGGIGFWVIGQIRKAAEGRPPVFEDGVIHNLATTWLINPLVEGFELLVGKLLDLVILITIEKFGIVALALAILIWKNNRKDKPTLPNE